MSFQTKASFAEIASIELGNEFIPDKFKKDNIWSKKN